MLKLVISDDEGKTTVVPLVRDEITIGRKEGNTIRLTERNVSRRHARLRKSDVGYAIEDLSSYNGVKINGHRIAEETTLQSGDQVTIGDYLIALQSEAAADVGRSSDAYGDPTPPARLVMLTPPAPGAEFTLRHGVKIGRAEDLDVWVNHRSISREHAEVTVDGDEVTIRDLKSANGMRVNGDEAKSTTLTSGDVLELGQVRFRFVPEGESYVFESDRTIQMDAVSVPQTATSRTSFIAAAVILLVAVAVGTGIALSNKGDDGQLPVAGPPEAAPLAAEGEGAPTGTAALVAECREAMAAERWDDAGELASRALAVEPDHPGAQECDRAVREQVEGERYRRAVTALDDGDVEAAYFAFEELPPGSPYRERPEMEQARAAFVAYHLSEARDAAASDTGQAESHANAVLTTDGVTEAEREDAEGILARLGQSAAADTASRMRRTRRPPTANEDTPSPTPMETAEAAMTSAAGPVNVREVQRTCNYDNRCIIDRLRGAPQNAQVLGVLVEAHRSVGNGPATRRLMQDYLRRYPNGPMAGAYQRQLGQ